MRFLVAAVLLACATPRVAGAQIYTPTFTAPTSGDDLGVYLSDAGDFAIEGIWRRQMGGYDLGFRAGVADDWRRSGDPALLVGAGLRNPFTIEDVPLELAVTAGAQAAVHADDSDAGFQIGVSVGDTFVPGTLAVTPYIHPRLAFVSSDEPNEDDLKLELLADIGFDFVFQPNLSIRIGFGLGDPTAGWGIGLSWR